MAMKKLVMAVATLVAFTAMASYSTWTDDRGYTWTYGCNYTSYITDVSPKEGDLIFPDNLGGKPVSQILGDAFKNASGITSLKIDKSHYHPIGMG
ncbi:MAG: hypothetical protein IKZ45_06200 [Fibrobacter sp.]|nr:hypothetical protein [Fibrobacter sp.]